MKRQKYFTQGIAVLVSISMLLSACGGAAKNNNSNGNHEEYINAGQNTTSNDANYSYNNMADNSGDAYYAEESLNESESDSAYDYGAAPQATAALAGANTASSESEYREVDEAENNPYADNSTYEDYGTNPFVDTDHDNLSTFAMDVDTGSYTIARNYLFDSYLPPENAIRVEEFVNYFDQGYAQPRNNQTFAIHLDGGNTPFSSNSDYATLRIGIQGMDISDYERDDMVLTFVIDVSGSMEQDGRLEIVKDALGLLVKELRRSDTVSIIAYSDEAWVVLQPTSGNNTNRILNAIEELHPTYSTNAEAGLQLGYVYANEAYDRDANNRVVLLSDGVANVGSTGPGSIWESISEYARNNIYLTTVGVGMGNYNDVLLEQLADQGDGFYAYVDTLDEAERLFVEDLTGTLQTIAKDAKVQVVFNPDVVERYRLIGYENREIADEDFNDPSVDAGEIGAGHSVTALYEVKLYDNARGEIANVVIHWEDPDTGKLYELDETIKTNDLDDRFYQTSLTFQQAVIVAEFAELLRGSYFAEEDSFSYLQNVAEESRWKMEGNEDYQELLELIDIAVWLTE